MTPTRPWQLLASGAGAFLLTYVLMRVYYLTSLTSSLPRTPVLSVAVVALVEAELGRGVRARLAGRPGSRAVLPITVARYAALARASSIAGALVVGAWAGVLAYTAPPRGSAAGRGCRHDHGRPGGDLGRGAHRGGALARVRMSATPPVTGLHEIAEPACRAQFSPDRTP